MSARDYDRMVLGDTNGNLFRVFVPPWYRVDRWLRYVFTRRIAKGRITLSLTEGTLDVRIVEERRVQLSRVPRAKP